MGRERSDFVVVANRLPVAPVDDASAPGGVRCYEIVTVSYR